MGIPRAQIRDKRGVWLLDLTIAGAVYRLGDEDAVVTDADGTAHAYVAALARPDATEEAGSVDRTVAVTLSPDAGVDWSLLVARGIDLSQGTGILRRWFEGQVLEQAEVVHEGDVKRPSYGDLNEGLTFSLERRPWDDETLIPEATAVVDEATWPTTRSSSAYASDDAVYGVAYPVIIGFPGAIGFVGLAAAPITPASPGLLVEYSIGATAYFDSRILIAGHEIEATTVRLYDMSDGLDDTRSVKTMADKLGRTVSYVDFLSATGIRPRLGHEYRVAFSTLTGGGLYNRTRTAALRGAGEVSRALLEGSLGALPATRIRIDVGRMEAARPLLDRYKVDAWIAERVQPWQWIVDHLVPMLPVREMQGPGGLYLQVWRRDATKADAVMHLDADIGDVTRDGPVDVSDEVIANHITVDYGPTISGGYQRRIILTGTPDASDARQRGSNRCLVSQQRYGVRSVEIELELVNDDATAEQVARDIAARLALPTSSLVVVGDAELGSVDLGDVVTFTDSTLHMTERVCLVRARQREDADEVALQLELLDWLPTTPRATT